MKNNILLAFFFLAVLLSFKTFPTKSEIINNRISELHTDKLRKRFDTLYGNRYLLFGHKVEQENDRTFDVVMLGLEIKDSLPSDKKVKELGDQYKFELEELYDDIWYDRFEVSFTKKETSSKGYTIYESKTYLVKN